MKFNAFAVVILFIFLIGKVQLLNSTNTTEISLEDRSSEEGRQTLTNPATGFGSIAYTNFVINEYSYKIWAAYQIATLAILLYSVVAAVYYSKWTFLQSVESPDYDADLLFKRSLPDQPKFNQISITHIIKSIQQFPQFLNKLNDKLNQYQTQDSDFIDS